MNHTNYVKNTELVGISELLNVKIVHFITVVFKMSQIVQFITVVFKMSQIVHFITVVFKMLCFLL